MLDYELQEIETVRIKKKELKSGYCNMCGLHYPFYGEHAFLESNLTTWKAEFNQGSRFAGCKVQFELCDACAEKLLDSFVHSPDWE